MGGQCRELAFGITRAILIGSACGVAGIATIFGFTFGGMFVGTMIGAEAVKPFGLVGLVMGACGVGSALGYLANR